ncbi:hypothetical protein P152DRAFT_415947 [Eremomyces bilateralis CBS 781.70]|uniref:Altered inheritance of mitochondria protein 21 n=1 Tax=Eremomyces bilateralis CBS 781.70 TaxID=1392243 RepID=A0A6G1G405_9PEZI|nr:uncharacterized protein P152DRAFT_415947 [Eremomyces bilateralis CBS 781.70]KAF1812827.1 hypothetical protein P152DRAFT_415947 [Eremomyces bilateralis CBS 781.70]
MTVPTIPPRPSRNGQSSGNSTNNDAPCIPARPKRTTEVAEERSYTRSPLNDPTFHNKNGLSLSKQSSQEFPQRPPSVNLPTIGHEGEEYDNMSFGTPPGEQTKNIAEDLPLHAPKASFASSTAKSRIQNVTRTDSQQAAAAGIGKAVGDIDERPSVPERPSLARTTSSHSQSSRPASIYKDDAEEGIPEIGVQIPLYKNAGDVQAPTPTLGPSNHSATSLPQLSRKTAAPDPFTGPPGSYGMHGHGFGPKITKIEKQWYQKHPEELARETEGEYGPAISADRKDWHLSSTELNELVYGSAKRAVGSGESYGSGPVGTPDEEIGNRAAEEYASRIASPRPPSAGGKPRSSSGQDVHVESPLHQMSFPASDTDPVSRLKHDHAIDSDHEDHDEDVIHVRDSRRGSYMCGTAYEPSPDAIGIRPESVTGDDDIHPILAGDEVMKNPSGEFLQPAVTPDPDRLALEMDEARQNAGSRSHSRAHSRAHSRTNSIQLALSRASSHDEGRESPVAGRTMLEDVYEYESLFPEDDEDTRKAKEHHNATLAGKPKRSSFARHQFPSQDVWEDAPSSLMYTTAVETPEPSLQPAHGDADAHHKYPAFETPASEHARHSALSQSFLPDHLARLGATPKPAFHPSVASETRPTAAQRFPSQDIWEDSPDYTQLVAEVRPSPSPDATPADTAPPAADKKPPSVPERAKPSIPARPARKPSTPSSEGAPVGSSLEKTPSAERAKPVVPPRGVGSKLAALKAGFMSDLNSRLQLGPQGPKKSPPEESTVTPEPEAEKAPLVDARKGRARGPQRRRPGVSPAADGAVAAKTVTFDFTPTVTLFEIDGEGWVEKEIVNGRGKETKDAEEVEEVKEEVMDQSTQTGLTEVETEREKVTILEGGNAGTGGMVVVGTVKDAAKDGDEKS